MRNLNLLRNLVLKEPSIVNISKCVIFTQFNDQSISKILICTNNLEIYLLDFLNDIPCNKIFVANLNDFILNISSIAVVGCDYLLNEVCVILNSGDYTIIPLLSPSTKDDIVIKKLDICDISVVSWSYDKERTVLINSAGIVFILCIQSDEVVKVNEFSLQTSSTEHNKLVNIGWGSAETQFRGSEGKYTESSTCENTNKNLEDEINAVAWKQNSLMFAVSYSNNFEFSRKIKIFNRDGVLLNITENIEGLHCVLSWWSARNLITCVQSLPSKKVLCFIEENALFHGNFQMSENMNIIQILWNTNGTILVCHGQNDKYASLMIWTTSNYKWYLKQNLKFEEHIRYIQWDCTYSNKLHVILNSGIYRIFEWYTEITESGKYDSPQNLSIVAVINGKTINYTPFKLVRCPPSMPYRNFEVTNCVNAVIFPTLNVNVNTPNDTDFDCNSVLLYLDNNKMLPCILKNRIYEITDYYIFMYKNEQVKFLSPVELFAWLWLLPNLLYFSWSRSDGYYFCIAYLNPKLQSIEILKSIRCKSLVTFITYFNEDVIIHLEDGSFFIYKNESLSPLNINFKEMCINLFTLKKEIISLTENKNLYVNQKIKWRDITSFYWKNPFLLLLTMDSKLLVSKVDIFEDELHFSEVCTRIIETKSYFVTVVEDQIILEMERGNLEIIKPRPFIIYKMEKLLREKKFLEVFKMLHSQRINLNLIFDHNPSIFLENAEQIVAVTEPFYLTMFITDLQNENIAHKMFPWKYDQISYNFNNKIQNICDTLCTFINKLNICKYILPLIAALMKQNKIAEAAKYAIECNEISYLFHFSDSESIYKAVLASFDLFNALQIAEHSNMDPSDYRPFLEELETLEENYRKFVISDYLKDHFEALKYLCNCESDIKFEESVKYILKYRLYNEALQIFNSKKKLSVGEGKINMRFLKIMNIVAEYYYENKLFNEAAVLYEKANLYDKSLNCYILIGDWFSAISTLNCLGYEKPDVKYFLEETYNSLHAKSKFEDAGFIACNFLKDTEKSIKSYLKAKKYCCAINVALSSRNRQAVDYKIKPILIEQQTNIIENLTKEYHLLNNYVERLRIIKENKLQFINCDYGLDSSSCISSDISDTCSLSSYNSKSSLSSSSKKSRRRERKLWNLKKGNPREEQSLINLIKEKIESNNRDYTMLVSDLVKSLIKIDKFNLAQELQKVYSLHLEHLNQIKTEVWPLEEIKEEGGFKDIQIKYPPDINTNQWELKIFH